MAELPNNLDQFPVFALDRIPNLVIITDADLEKPGGPRMVYVNRTLLEMTGYTEAELLGRSPRVFQGELTDRATLNRVKDALQAGAEVREAVLNYTKSGNTYWTELNISPVRNSSGEIIFFLSVQRNITDEMKIAEILDKTISRNNILEHHFAHARIAAKIGIFEYSVEQDEQKWSPELFHMTGLSEDGFPAPAKEFISRIDRADRPRFIDVFERAVNHGKDYTITVRFRRPDGGIMHMQIIAEARDRDGTRQIIGIARDVTDEAEASHLLRTQEERFRIIADTVSDVLWDFELDKATWWVSPNWPQKLGLSFDGGDFTPMQWIDYIVPDERDAAAASLRAAYKSGQSRWHGEFRVVDLDGSRVDVEINATILRRDDGRVYRALGNLRNVTTDNQRREGFTRSRALEAVGKMTGGIAHDFNNLLMIIQGNAELLAMADLSAEDRESLRLIAKASHTAASLTARLLSFSGQTSFNTTCVNLNQAIDELAPLVQSGVTSAIDLRTSVAEDIWNIEVDAAALEQAIINLAVNARDAMPQGGVIELACSNHIAVRGNSGPVRNLAPGRYVCISVTDEGHGMSEDVVAKACEPFFTTKDVGKGTGLGLSTVYGFARQSGGGLHIASELGKGSVISIYLPASFSAAAIDQPTPSPMTASTPKPTGARILMVEDQPDVRHHVERLLRRQGFDVTAACDAKAALSILETGETFAVLFTDIVMPGGISGVQLAERAGKIAPDMKVLFTSGFPASAFAEVGAGAAGQHRLIPKPYKTNELIDMISDLIGA